MFEFDLKACKFLIVKNTGEGAAGHNTEKQILEKLGGFITDTIAEKNSSSLNKYFHEEDSSAVQKALTELQRAGRTVFRGACILLMAIITGIVFIWRWYLMISGRSSVF